MSHIDERTGRPKIILDLCGGTGAWGRPYLEAGYDVRLITLPEYDVCTYEPPENVYGILAAPPCTEFSRAKGSRPRDLAGAMEIVEACLRVVWRSRPKFWTLENPVGLLRQFLGKPVMTFEQWQFGDGKIKPTDLWGYFSLPETTVKERPSHLVSQHKYANRHGRMHSCPECPPEYQDYVSQFTGDARRASIRAITTAGFAQAFFKANR